MVAMCWNYDRECAWHTKGIPEEDDAFVFVYKTGGGDYAISAMREGDMAGGDVEYEQTLVRAKKYADGLIVSGGYKEMFL